MKTIAVTGSSGFIGKHLVAKLISNSYKVIEIDYDKGLDLLNKGDLAGLPNFDIIIHLAAKSFVPKSFETPWAYYHDNFLSTLNVLELARRFSARVIFFSSYLYGEPEYLPLDENHPLKPHNPYAQSKLICEKLCEGYYRDFDVPVIIFRPFNIYGKGQNNSFLIPMIIGQLQSGEIKLKDPRPRRDFIHVNDVTDAVMHAIDYKKSRFEILNLGYGKSFSISQIVEIIMKAFGKSANVFYSDEIRQGEVLDTIASTSKLKACFNWKPSVNFIDGINALID